MLLLLLLLRRRRRRRRRRLLLLAELRLLFPLLLLLLAELRLLFPPLLLLRLLRPRCGCFEASAAAFDLRSTLLPRLLTGRGQWWAECAAPPAARRGMVGTAVSARALR